MNYEEKQFPSCRRSSDQDREKRTKEQDDKKLNLESPEITLGYLCFESATSFPERLFLNVFLRKLFFRSAIMGVFAFSDAFHLAVIHKP